MNKDKLKIKEATLIGLIAGSILSGGSGAVIGGLIGLLIDNEKKIKK